MNAPAPTISFTGIFVGLMSFILAIPLFTLAYYRLPDLAWPYHADKILVFVIIAILLLLIVRSFKFIIVTAVIALTGWLWYGTVSGKYGFTELYKDARAMFYNLQSDSNDKGYVFTGSRALSTDVEIMRAIDYKNPAVRDFAVQAANEYFEDEQRAKLKYHTLVQCLAVFKKINSNWNYVSDPENEEYIAKASESVKLLAGDCDDHSILMAAAIKAIGGTTRLVYTTGHIYPELRVGNKKDFEYINNLIHKKLFADESRGRPVHYHIDEKGNYWLNIDYTAGYPGGRFMANDVIECLYP